MNLDLKNVIGKISPLLQKVREYIGFVIVLAILGAFGFIVWRIRYYANMQPTSTAVDQKLQALQRTQIDQETIAKIQNLQSSNVQVKALFERARKNPFKE